MVLVLLWLPICTRWFRRESERLHWSLDQWMQVHVVEGIRASLAGKEFPGRLRLGWFQVGLRLAIRRVQEVGLSLMPEEPPAVSVPAGLQRSLAQWIWVDVGDDIRASMAGKKFPGVLGAGWFRVGLG